MVDRIVSESIHTFLLDGVLFTNRTARVFSMAKFQL